MGISAAEYRLACAAAKGSLFLCDFEDSARNWVKEGFSKVSWAHFHIRTWDHATHGYFLRDSVGDWPDEKLNFWVGPLAWELTIPASAPTSVFRRSHSSRWSLNNIQIFSNHSYFRLVKEIWLIHKSFLSLNLPAFALALVLNLDLILAGFGRGRRNILLLPDEIVLNGLRSFVSAGSPLLEEEIS